jgi:hypothetical protein
MRSRESCRADLGLPDGARRLDVEDDRGLQVDEVVVGIGKEGMASERLSIVRPDPMTHPIISISPSLVCGLIMLSWLLL